MASETRLFFDGLETFKQQLRALPDHLRDEARDIVGRAARDAYESITAAYPEVTGNLKRGMRIEVADPSQYGVGALVRNVAKHAWLFENGTQTIRVTKQGWKRGPMRPGKIFIPRAIRHRKFMNQRLVELIASTGLQVTHNAAA